MRKLIGIRTNAHLCQRAVQCLTPSIGILLRCVQCWYDDVHHVVVNCSRCLRFIFETRSTVTCAIIHSLFRYPTKELIHSLAIWGLLSLIWTYPESCYNDQAEPWGSAAKQETINSKSSWLWVIILQYNFLLHKNKYSPTHFILHLQLCQSRYCHYCHP